MDTPSAASSGENDSQVTLNVPARALVVTRFEEALVAALLRIPTMHHLSTVEVDDLEAAA
jgi:hypothetical protein